MNRFPNPQQLMAYLGLIPSEHSSGKKVSRGSITKTGNNHVRRVVVEAAWTYKMPARKSIILLKRQQGLPKSVCASSQKGVCLVISLQNHKCQETLELLI